MYSFRLLDGSDIYLPTNGTIKYTPDFGEREKKLVTDGEIIIHPNESNIPFIIETAHFTLEIIADVIHLEPFPEEKESVLKLKGEMTSCKITAPYFLSIPRISELTIPHEQKKAISNTLR